VQICGGDGELLRCANDEWVADAPCAEGERCHDGECLTEACAYAARTASYLGCDYLAVDLPNSAFDERDSDFDGQPDGTTENAPVGIVVANSSATETVTLTLSGPNGVPAALVASRLIPVPNIPEIQGRYQAETVQSQIMDANGMVVQGSLARAENVEIPPGGQGTFLLPRQMGPLDESSLRKDAFRVKTDFPVVVYQFSPYCCNYSFTNDASLLLPTAALGTRYRFLGVPFHQVRDPFGGIRAESPQVMAIVSPTEDNEVNVRLPAGMIVASDSTGSVTQRGNEVTAQMGRQDVLLLAGSSNPTPGDLTGSEITSEKPIAVFSAHTCTYYPEDLGACDHLQEQLFPVSTWGNSFQLVPPAERGQNAPAEVIYWKIIGGDEVTRFTLGLPFRQLNPVTPGFEMVPYCGNYLEGDTTIVLRPGQFCEFGTKRAVQLAADQPAMVMGIITGQGATNLGNFGTHAGDPAIFLVPPDQQYRREYTFLTPDTYFSDYVTIVTATGNEILLDGQPINFGDAIPVGGSIFQFKHVSISDGAHQPVGRSPFGIVVYAYDDFVSYAFTGGLNLTKR
jgi:hypothetical protein